MSPIHLIMVYGTCWQGMSWFHSDERQNHNHQECNHSTGEHSYHSSCFLLFWLFSRFLGGLALGLRSIANKNTFSFVCSSKIGSQVQSLVREKRELGSQTTFFKRNPVHESYMRMWVVVNLWYCLASICRSGTTMAMIGTSWETWVSSAQDLWVTRCTWHVSTIPPVGCWRTTVWPRWRLIQQWVGSIKA